MPRSRRPRVWVAIAFAALAYLGAALWVTRGAWADPSVLLFGRPETDAVAPVARADQAMVLAVVMGNADRILHHPADLGEDGQCYPFPHPFTLGEHMFGEGLLAAVPLAFTGDPIVTYNVLFVLTLWIPAMTMFALSFELTRSLPGSFVAGMLFGFLRLRLDNPAHPFVHGDLWTPLVLLFLYRVFTRRTWGSALGLTVFGLLELGESIYPLVAATILLGANTLSLAVHHRRDLLSLAPKLALCVAAAFLGAWVILGPYLETAATWHTLSDRPAFLAAPGLFGPGQSFYPGTLVLGLAALGFAGRLRGPRRLDGTDARWPLAIAAVLTFWYVAQALPVPGTSMHIPPLYNLLRGIVPGLDAARVPSAARTGLYLALCALAGYGAAVILDGLRPAWRVGLAGLLALAGLVEVTHPAVARSSFGAPVEAEVYHAAPPAAETTLLQHVVGPVFNYPAMMGNFDAQEHYLLQAAYHRQSTSACYNSMTSPLADEMTRLGRQVPAPKALEALAALGFRTVVVHRHSMSMSLRKTFLARRVQDRSAGDHLLPLAITDDLRIYRLRGLGETSESLDLLAPGTEPVPMTVAAAQEARLALPVRNQGTRTFRHPDPIEPSPVVVTWYDESGHRVSDKRRRALLPLAIAPGDSAPLRLSVPVELPPGRYRVTVAPTTAPSQRLADHEVTVTADP